jgi:hypothetical protein
MGRIDPVKSNRGTQGEKETDQRPRSHPVQGYHETLRQKLLVSSGVGQDVTGRYVDGGWRTSNCIQAQK